LKRKVFAGDICLNSLRLAKGFADCYAIRIVAFLQMNLFRPPFRDGVFDVVISNGVLHHTRDCEGGFRSVLAKLKPGGFILVGLYNSYARLPTLWKRWAFRAFGPKLYFLDARLRDLAAAPGRVKAWFMDQYRHPHETKHSMGEVLEWFDRYGVDFVNGIPHLDGSEFNETERLLAPYSRGSRYAWADPDGNAVVGWKGRWLVHHDRKKTLRHSRPNSMPMKILGISAFYHDSAAAIVATAAFCRSAGGAVVAKEARREFSASRHRSLFRPHQVRARRHRLVVFYDKPFLKFERLLKPIPASHRAIPPFRMAMPLGSRKTVPEAVAARRTSAIRSDFDEDKRLLFSEHHQPCCQRILSAPFQDAARS
jgi:SAM-dependent methyltransferase